MAAKSIRASGFREGFAGRGVFTTSDLRQAVGYARQRAREASAVHGPDVKPSVVVAKIRRGAVNAAEPHQAARGIRSDFAQNVRPVRGMSGELGALRPSKIVDFPDTMANTARRIRSRVMASITSQDRESYLTSRIAEVSSEIERLGGKPPKAPFAGATTKKLTAAREEIARLGRITEEEKTRPTSLRNLSNIRERVTKAIQSERGSLRLPGTRSMRASDLKPISRGGSANLPPPIVEGDAEAKSLRSELMKVVISEYKMKPIARLHARRLPRN